MTLNQCQCMSDAHWAVPYLTYFIPFICCLLGCVVFLSQCYNLCSQGYNLHLFIHNWTTSPQETQPAETIKSSQFGANAKCMKPGTGDEKLRPTTFEAHCIWQCSRFGIWIFSSKGLQDDAIRGVTPILLDVCTCYWNKSSKYTYPHW